MGSVPDHDVVVQLNFESPGGRLQFSRHLDVGPGRFGIATWMIMDRDQRSGVESQGTLQDLTWVNRRVIDRATLLHLVGDEIVLGIKKQDSKLLDLLVSHGRLQVGNERLPIAQHGPPAHFCFGHAARDFPDKPKRSDVTSRQSECAKLRQFGGDDMANARKVLQESRSSCATLR